jgi:hypothetical protein
MILTIVNFTKITYYWIKFHNLLNFVHYFVYNILGPVYNILKEILKSILKETSFSLYRETINLDYI